MPLKRLRNTKNILKPLFKLSVIKLRYYLTYVILSLVGIILFLIRNQVDILNIFIKEKVLTILSRKYLRVTSKNLWPISGVASS